MDMFDEPNEVIMLFEIPGVEKKDVRCVLEGDILLLEAKAADRVYRKEALIEAPLAKGEPHLRLRNGVLEVRLAKRK
jgi:HSP20 family protein